MPYRHILEMREKTEEAVNEKLDKGAIEPAVLERARTDFFCSKERWIAEVLFRLPPTKSSSGVG